MIDPSRRRSRDQCSHRYRLYRPYFELNSVHLLPSNDESVSDLEWPPRADPRICARAGDSTRGGGSVVERVSMRSIDGLVTPCPSHYTRHRESASGERAVTR